MKSQIFNAKKDFMKHTQGDWKAGVHINAAEHTTNPIVKINGKALCEIDSTHSGFGNEAEANAKLIAAAPELLEALQTCYNWAKNGNKEALIVFEKALSAIKKATE